MIAVIKVPRSVITVPVELVKQNQSVMRRKDGSNFYWVIPNELVTIVIRLDGASGDALQEQLVVLTVLSGNVQRNQYWDATNVFRIQIVLA